MKFNILMAVFLTSIINIHPLQACEIVNKRNIHMDGRKGVEGNCSNNGEKIHCYEVGEYSGGISCHGPVGDNTGTNLKELIYAVCGCTPEDLESIDKQMDKERSE